MSALAVLPRPVSAAAREPGAPVTSRRGHLSLVGPDFVPAAPPAGPGDRAARRQAVAGHMRLTRRGRRVLGGVALVVATATSAGVGALAGAVVSTGPAAHDAVTVSVAPGDTLWGLAAGVSGPDQDVREVVEDIVAANGLRGHELHVGQRLQLPG